MTINTTLVKLIPVTFAAIIFTPPASAGDAAAGKAIYDGNGAYATCHGAAGAGDSIKIQRYNAQ